MGKILAIVFLVVFAWFAVPRLAQAQWFAPTLYPSSWWGQQVYNYPPVVQNRGWGWFSFNVWGGQPSFQAGYTPLWGAQNWNGGWGNTLPYNGGWGAANAYNGYIW